MAMRIIVALGLLLGALLVVVPAARGADDVASTYFEQLRRRGLFSVAEGYCIDKLAARDITDDARARLTLELSRTLAEHARYASGDESVELFDRAQNILDEHLAKYPRHPLQLLLVVQRALLPAARGEFLRWQVELFPHDSKLHAQAVSTFDDAISRLGKAEQTLADQLRAAAPGRGANAAIKPHEIRTLLNNVRLELGSAHLERAKLFASGSAERVAELMAADEWLRRLLGGPAGEDLTWRSQLRLAESNRLRGDFKQALAMLATVEKGTPPEPAQDEIIAQRARIQLDDGRYDEAARLLVTYDRTRAGLPGELQYLRVSALIGMWEIAHTKKSARDSTLADELFKQLKSSVARVEKEVGGYWAYRCRQLLDSAGETARYGGEVAEIVRTARGAYAAGKVDEAVEAYARAAKLAEQGGRDEQAFELGYSRASILLESERYDPAAAGFLAIAAKYPQQPRAADAHLLWAWCLGKKYDQSRSDQQHNEFASALAAHREKFPNHASAADATWMLAELEERRQQFERSLKLYLEVPATHAHGLEAQAAVARCYEAILERLRANDQLHAAWENEAIRRLDKLAATFPAESVALSPPQADLSLRLARIRLNQAQPDYARADRLLARIFTSAPRTDGQADASLPANVAWRSLLAAAAQLRIVSLAGQKRLDEAESFVRRLSDASPQEVLNVLDGLTQVGVYADEATRRGLGELQLKAAEKLAARRKELSAADAQRLDHCLAQANLATGQPNRAIAIYESLVAANPRDAVLMKTVADLLTVCGTPACIEKALGYWRKIEAREKQGSREWLVASQAIASCCLRLKQYDECRKILKVTRVLYPELGGPELKAKFEKLQAELERVTEHGPQ